MSITSDILRVLSDPLCESTLYAVIADSDRIATHLAFKCFSDDFTRSPDIYKREDYPLYQLANLLCDFPDLEPNQRRRSIENVATGWLTRLIDDCGVGAIPEPTRRRITKSYFMSHAIVYDIAKTEAIRGSGSRFMTTEHLAPFDLRGARDGLAAAAKDINEDREEKVPTSWNRILIDLSRMLVAQEIKRRANTAAR